MSRPTERTRLDGVGLDRTDVERMVGAVAPEWSVERVRPVEDGTADVVFVTAGTPGGSRETVLKAAAGGPVADAVARAEPRLLDLLSSETDVPVPDLLGAVDDHPDLPTPFLLTDRVAGADGSGLFDDLSPEALERVLADAGRNLAALHDLRSFDRSGRVGVADGDLAVVGGAYGPQDRWTDWLLADTEDTLDGMEGGPFADLVAPLRAFVRDAVPALDAPDAGAFVHWDYRFGNLLLDPDTGETTAVLDWADLVAGDPLYNLVAVEDHNVNWQTNDGRLRRRLRERFRAAYDAHRAGGWPADAGDRTRVYRLCHRLNAMACLPDWYADAADAVYDRREAEHRAFARSYLD